MMTGKHDPVSPGVRQASTVLFIAMVIFLGLSMIASFMDHINIAVALAGVAGLAMIGMFMCMIEATFLPLPDFPMADDLRSHHLQVDDTPTTH